MHIYVLYLYITYSIDVWVRLNAGGLVNIGPTDLVVGMHRSSNISVSFAFLETAAEIDQVSRVILDS
jgi:uncharacterized membrane protein